MVDSIIFNFAGSSVTFQVLEPRLQEIVATQQDVDLAIVATAQDLLVRLPGISEEDFAALIENNPAVLKILKEAISKPQTQFPKTSRFVKDPKKLFAGANPRYTELVRKSYSDYLRYIVETYPEFSQELAQILAAPKPSIAELMDKVDMISSLLSLFKKTGLRLFTPPPLPQKVQEKLESLAKKWKLSIYEKKRLEDLLQSPYFEPKESVKALVKLGDSTTPSEIKKFLDLYNNYLALKPFTRQAKEDLLANIEKPYCLPTAVILFFEGIADALLPVGSPKSAITINRLFPRSLETSDSNILEESAITTDNRSLLFRYWSSPDSIKEAALEKDFAEAKALIDKGQRREGLIVILAGKRIDEPIRKSFFKLHPQGTLILVTENGFKRILD